MGAAPPSKPSPPPGPPRKYNSFFLKNTRIHDDVGSIEDAVAKLVADVGVSPGTNGLICLGWRGDGKSSTLNTIQACLRHRLYDLAPAGQVGSTITHSWDKFRLVRADGTKVQFNWIDTPGDLILKLGHIWRLHKNPENIPFLESAYRDKTALLESIVISPCLANHVGCIMLVISALSLKQSLVESESVQLEVYWHLHKVALKHGLNVVCVITKVDLVDARIKQGTVNICESETVDKIMNHASRKIGLNKNKVYPVANLNDERDPAEDPRKCFLCLSAVYNALGAGMAAHHAPEEAENGAVGDN